jgi:uncharacterized damage-inducible protein DinB
MMDAIIATIELTRQSLLKLVADLSDAQLTLQPAPKTNHPAWVLGHQLFVDYNFLKLIGGPETAVTDEFKKLYGGNSTPLADAALYQNKQWYLERMHEVRQQIYARLKTLTPEQYNAPHPDPNRRQRTPTVLHAILLYGTWHEAYHAGQLSAWRRVQGLPPV